MSQGPDAGLDALQQDWRSQANWTLLDTDFAQGQRFLACWQAWRQHPGRPRRLQVLAFCEHSPQLDTGTQTGALAPLAQALRTRCWGLVPGCHHLLFEAEQLSLTLFIGPRERMWREWRASPDGIWVAQDDHLTPDRLKTLARQCRPGARLFFTARVPTQNAAPTHWQAHLQSCGFVAPSHSVCFDGQAEYRPNWTPRRTSPAGPPATWTSAREALVLGAGLAGAHVAWSLAQRGWRVRVLDRAAQPAAGASGLPAGLLAPHVSADDSLASRLSRAGLRLTWQRAQTLLREGVDWQACGVLRHDVDGAAAEQAPQSRAETPTPAHDPGSDWTQPPSQAQLALAGLDASHPTRWHPHAAWIRPAALVRALLAHPGIEWRGRCEVQGIEAVDGAWQVQDAQGRVLDQAALLVLAAGFDSRALLPAANTCPLQALRGQVTWGTLMPGAASGPALGMNGHGSLIHGLPTDQGQAWLMGSSFDRDDTDLRCRDSDNAANLMRLDRLAPAIAAQARRSAPSSLQAWAGLRCASPDRLPLLGPLRLAGVPASEQPPPLQLCTALGSRGLSLAGLCGELLAAALCDEVWPLEARLARALWAGRYGGARPFS